MAIVKLTKSGKGLLFISDSGTCYNTSVGFVKSLLGGNLKKPFVLLSRLPFVVSEDRFTKSHVYNPGGIEVDTKDNVTIIASSDMSHYESNDEARAKDMKAIEMMLQLNERGLIETVERFGISMCGYAPVAVMISAAKELGASQAELVRYQTSGDVTGDYSAVVGYAGIIVT